MVLALAAGGSSAASGSTPATDPAWLDPFDAYARREAVGPAALASEQAVLDRAQASDPANPTRADRLARLTLAASSVDRVQYEQRLSNVYAALFDRRRNLALIGSGAALPTEWRTNFWLREREKARDPSAKELFSRILLDQYPSLAYEQKLKPRLDSVESRAFDIVTDADAALIERRNAAWLKETLARIGWFDISRYGKAASQAAWLIAQHADFNIPWQKRLLGELAPRVRSGDMQGDFYAYLVDRVAVNSGARQTYGTQGACVAPGRWQAKPLSDPARLDALRAAVGLQPMAAYEKINSAHCD